MQFRFEKRKLSFNAFAVFSSHSVPFPSINRSVPFRSVLSRFVAFRVFILGRQVYTLFQLETLRERCLTPSTCDAALVLHSRGLTARAIVDSLADEGLSATPKGIAKFLRRVQDTGTLERQPGSD